MAVSPQAVERLLNPTSVAVVGASDRPGSWSAAYVANLTRWGFPGRVHLVNSQRDEVLGQIAYRSLASIPESVDHAIVVVPAAALPLVLKDCHRAGVSSVTVISAGFSETGPEGAQLAERAAALCREHDIAMIGPNCFGFINFHGPSVLSRNALEGPPRPGDVSLVFQSGQLNLSAYGASVGRGVDLRYLISSGNELVVDTNDFFDYFLHDDATRVLGGAIERIPDAARFERIALDALELGKPVVICKQGRSEAGQRAAALHTASVAGVDAVVSTFLRDLGVVLVESVDELVETTGVLAREGWPPGPRAVFVGGSGGAGGYFADSCEGLSIELNPLSPLLVDEVVTVSGVAAEAVNNPLDLTATGAGTLRTVVATLSASPEVDLVVCQGEEPRSVEVHGQRHVDLLAGHMAGVASVKAASGWACFVSAADREPSEFGKEMAASYGVHYLHGLVGIRSLSHAVQYGQGREVLLARGRTRVARRTEMIRRHADNLLPRGLLSEWESLEILRDAGLPVAESYLCTSVAEAQLAAEKLGWPVVVKVASADIPHKSDVGGVVTGVGGEDALVRAFEQVVAAGASQPGAVVDGAVVARQLVAKVELLLGVVSDPDIGPVVVVGAGGTYVEVVKDVAMALPPFDEGVAAELLHRLSVWPLLAGTRGEDPADVAAVCEALARLSDAVAAMDHRIVAMDVNPLFVMGEGGGVVAVDASVQLAQDGPPVRAEVP